MVSESGKFISLSEQESILGDFASLEVFNFNRNKLQ